MLSDERLAEIETHAQAMRAVKPSYMAEDLVPELLAEVRRLRAALAYYADRSAWAYGVGVRDGQPVDLAPRVLRDDEGDRAREALPPC